MKIVNKYLVATLLLSNVLATATDLPDLKAAPTDAQLAKLDADAIKRMSNIYYWVGRSLMKHTQEQVRDNHCQVLVKELATILVKDQIPGADRLSLLATCTQLNPKSSKNEAGSKSLDIVLDMHHHITTKLPEETQIVDILQQIITILVAGSADTFFDEYNYDTVSKCIICKYVERISLLRQAGSDLNAPLRNGTLPIFAAIHYNSADKPEVTQAFLDNGVKRDVIDKQGRNIVQAALHEYFTDHRSTKTTETLEVVAAALPDCTLTDEEIKEIKNSDKLLKIPAFESRFASSKLEELIAENKDDYTLKTFANHHQSILGQPLPNGELAIVHAIKTDAYNAVASLWHCPKLLEVTDNQGNNLLQVALAAYKINKNPSSENIVREFAYPYFTHKLTADEIKLIQQDDNLLAIEAFAKYRPTAKTISSDTPTSLDATLAAIKAFEENNI